MAETRICLAILTTGTRAAALEACLRGAAAVIVPQGVTLDILLVQNGVPEISADLWDYRGYFTDPDRFDIVLAPQKGIPFGRNCGLDHAQAQGYDYLAFIDDDACPDADWLTQSLAALRAAHAEAVSGPQIPVFPAQTGQAMQQAKIHAERRLADGTRLTWAATNNVIFSLAFARTHGLRFDESFQTGGSDKAFFLRFTHAGGQLIWARDAVVRETVIPARLSMGWALKRAFRLGATGFALEKTHRTPPMAALVSLFKGAVYIVTGALRLPLGLMPGHPGFLDGITDIWRGAGFILGIVPVFRHKRYV